LMYVHSRLQFERKMFQQQKCMHPCRMYRYSRGTKFVLDAVNIPSDNIL